ncbi:type II and III secretion system protein family protein [Tsuneonella sp. YG55]|uniref:Type II and III secretion system protein family protein n=1 Tax=Tsuneonella litorea TaxID=2976475 RepID=A0A9X3ANH1_9SPHN|nr:type II and III secretion system protein family protein [Tsuneonella litorea]MCT2559682.1 type II and III secretion system protein family protein [Tsuneonella litorea]
MKRRLTATLLLAGLAAGPLAGIGALPAAAQNVISPTRDINLSIGRGELINIPDTMSDVFIANDNVADVQIKSERQLYLFGKSGGVTTVYASNKAGAVIWSANVRVGSNIDSVDQMLALAMPEAQVNVATMGTNTFLLTGTVAAPEDAAEAERLVQAFVGEDANVITRLKTATPLQVNLQVRFAEVSRSLVREIGANLQTVDSTGGFKFGVTTGRGATTTYTPGSPAGLGVGFTSAPPNGSLVKGNGSGSTLAGFGKLFGLDIASAFDLAERVGLISTLSQPNLTALSGETADFLAGGEFPIPISQGLGSTSIEYRKYGVSLAYTPTVLANGRISLRVRPEVSELSSQGAVTINGFQIPALTIRRAETTIELGSGQSFMIAGLMSNNAQNSIDKTPGLGDVPILGNLFRSTSFRKGETELVIVVTPYLVQPVNERDIKLPTDGFRAADEATRLFGMQDNAGVTGAARPGPTTVQGQNPVAPGISQALPDAVAPSGSSKRKKRRTAKNDADAPAPGFSIQ